MKNAFLASSLLLFGGSLLAAANPPPLVDSTWVKANGCRPDVMVLDVRSEKIDGQSKEDYLKGHIPCAVHSDYIKAGWRAKQKDVPGMLPPVDKLEELIGGLGIDNDTHVVVVPQGDKGVSMGSATRVYWTFKVLGHDKVSILDGGHAGYAKKKEHKLEQGDFTRPAKGFKAALRKDMLVSKQDVQAAMAESVRLVDMRNPDQYLGINKHGKTKRHGTVPGASNLPFVWLTLNNQGRFRSSEGLKEAYRIKAVPTEGEQITFCNTGHLASIGWFASSELLGNKSAKLYDGSMAEWTRDEKLKMDRRITMKE